MTRLIDNVQELISWTLIRIQTWFPVRIEPLSMRSELTYIDGKLCGLSSDAEGKSPRSTYTSNVRDRRASVFDLG